MELEIRREDVEGLCGRKRARLTRFDNDCFEVDFYFDKKKSFDLKSNFVFSNYFFRINC